MAGPIRLKGEGKEHEGTKRTLMFMLVRGELPSVPI